MQTNNKLREAVELAKSTFETLIQFQGDEGFVKTWAGLGRDAMIAALATSATTEKSSAVGDAAKLREALELCAKCMCGYCIMDAEARGMSAECVNGCEALRKAKAALAAPPRNCDRFTTVDEAIGAYQQTHKHMVVNVFLDWLFAPATEKEGDNDGNE